MGNEATETGKVGTQTQTEDQPGNEGGSSVEKGSQGSTQAGGTESGRGLDGLPKWAQDLIRDTRSEAANYRTKLREKESELEKAGLDENQKAIKEAEEQATKQALSKANERIKMAEARSALAQAKIVNPKDQTLRLLDLSQVEVDDNGNVSGLDQAVEALKTDYPNLVEGATTNPSLGNRPPEENKPDMNQTIRAWAGRG